MVAGLVVLLVALVVVALGLVVVLVVVVPTCTIIYSVNFPPRTDIYIYIYIYIYQRRFVRQRITTYDHIVAHGAVVDEGDKKNYLS